MRPRFKAVFISLCLALGIQVAAAQAASSDSQKNKTMQSCRQQMQKMRAENSEARKQIEDAKTSNDPTQMRAALDAAEKSLDRMNSHMNMCMDMGMMQHMKGMGGMMDSSDQTRQDEHKKGTMSEQQPAPKDQPNEPPK